MKDLLLITPPFTQLNTPYPATAYLKGFLNTKGISSYQMDLGIEVILNLFSKKGISNLFENQAITKSYWSDNAKRIFAFKNEYIQSIDSVISFLQGKNQNFARRIATDFYLPQASRFDQLDDLDWAFGSMGLQDKAKHLATLYLEDLSDFIKECVDQHFGFSRYAERLGMSANSFDQLYDHLQKAPSYIDQITIKILNEKIKEISPKLVCLSVPFPGNLYSAFRSAQFIKQKYPDIKIALGGGFANTELRSVSDPRVFEFFDFISLDDGELPIELIASNVVNPTPDNPNFNFLKRTFILDQGEVVYNNFSLRTDYKQEELGTPDYSDLRLDKYISVIELANPMHSLWSDGRWLKLTMAHGCYWGKCTFCDISLDYIKNYEPLTASLLVDRMEEMIDQTGETGFHFVDEAAPPALMKALAIEIIKRKLALSWWANIRFEKSFTADLCKLLHASGCIAVSGGLEVASDRLLALIDKGVTVAQVAIVNRNFTDAGIMVHAYLMYGYPTQTVQETIDSLEMVRQLFELGILQSGFWHQFALTAHSPIGMKPEKYGVLPDYKEITFANNDVQFKDKTGIDHSQFSDGLKKSLYNYMHGIGLDFPLGKWFGFKIPKTTIVYDYIAVCIDDEPMTQAKPNSKIVWLGVLPELVEKKVKSEISIFDKQDTFQLSESTDKAKWIIYILKRAQINEKELLTFNDLRSDYEQYFDDFDLFWYGESMEALKELGLLIL